MLFHRVLYVGENKYISNKRINTLKHFSRCKPFFSEGKNPFGAVYTLDSLSDLNIRYISFHTYLFTITWSMFYYFLIKIKEDLGTPSYFLINVLSFFYYFLIKIKEALATPPCFIVFFHYCVTYLTYSFLASEFIKLINNIKIQ